MCQQLRVLLKHVKYQKNNLISCRKYSFLMVSGFIIIKNDSLTMVMSQVV